MCDIRPGPVGRSSKAKPESSDGVTILQINEGIQDPPAAGMRQPVIVAVREADEHFLDWFV